ncbi:MAG: relaxase/mobilization nuclease domain-containing protein [Steroidobacteraceae bacterium]
MPNLRISPLKHRPLLDIASYARRGPGHRIRLSLEEIAQIGRAVRRTPEVMVKVLSKNSNDLRSVARHFHYIGRRGELELETDEGSRPHGKAAGQQIVEDWDLDLEKDRRDSLLSAGSGRAPKLVHKIMLSMPPGTPAKGVLQAARTFAREEFALKHRYALVLHTDEPHPHVHLVVKAVSEQGVRLNISKAILRDWRRAFAWHLREQGIAANATERAVRGQTQTPKLDGIYRAAQRGVSSHMRFRVHSVAAELATGGLRAEPKKSQLLRTRRAVERGWQSVADALAATGRLELAFQVKRFMSEMPPVMTEKERIAADFGGRRTTITMHRDSIGR